MHNPCPPGNAQLPSHEEVLQFFPTGTLIEKVHGDHVHQGQVYDNSGRYWGVELTENDWCETTWRYPEGTIQRTAQDGPVRKASWGGTSWEAVDR